MSLFDRLGIAPPPRNAEPSTRREPSIFDRLQISPEGRERAARLMETDAETIRSRGRYGPQVERTKADYGRNDGVLDQIGDFLDRGEQSFYSGVNAVGAGLLRGMGFNRAAARKQAEADARQEISNAAIADEATEADVRANPLRLPEYIAEKALGSAAPMAAAAVPFVGLAATAGSGAGQIAMRRAQNDGRDLPTAKDWGIGVGAGLASAALERVGIKGIAGGVQKGGLRAVVRSAGKEGATEAAQTAIEETASTAGTARGFRPGEVLEQSAWASLVGAGMGGTLTATGSAGREGIAKARPIAAGVIERAKAMASTLTPSDRSSPLPDDLIASGRTATAGAQAQGTADSILTAMGAPKVGTRIRLTMPDGRVGFGVIEDAFDEQMDGERVAGISFRPDGADEPVRVNIADLVDSGAVIEPDNALVPSGALAEADAIDAHLRAAAMAPMVQPGPIALPALPAPGAPRGAAPARRSMQPGATPATLPAPAGGFDPAAFKAAVRGPESGGDDRAVNRMGSSASGRYQFIKSTFVALYNRAYKNGGGEGAWNSQARFAPEVQERLMDLMMADRVANYRRNGVPITNGTMYLGHVLGDAGALKLLRANPNTPVASLLSAEIVRQNPTYFGGGKTVGQAISVIAGKVGGGGAGAMPAAPGHPAATIDFADRAHDARSSPDAKIDFGPIPQRRPDSMRVSDRAETAVAATGREMPVRYGLVELADLIASNEPDGRVNPSYPAERQPRDRTRAASQAQVRTMAATLDPRLLARSVRAADGAPIIGPDGVVDSGNGRVMALSQAYAENGDRANAYRQMVASEGAALGLDAAGMSQPVLVRVRDGEMPPEEVEAFTRDANVRDTAAMSAIETASSDAAALSSGRFKILSSAPRSAEGKIDEKALRDSVDPSLPISPGAQTQASSDQTYAPAPTSATGRSSTTRSTASNDVMGTSAAKVGPQDGERNADEREGPGAVGAQQERIRASMRESLARSDSATQGDNYFSLSKARKGGGWEYRVEHPLSDAVWVNAKASSRQEAVERLASLAADFADVRPTRPAAATDPATPAASSPKAVPSPNRLVSDDRAAELRARLRKKLDGNQLNSGIDPEILAIGAELAVYHIEKGARRFTAFARAVADDLDMPIDRLRQYLRSWYNGARDIMEDSGVAIDGMDGPDEVRAALAKLADAPEPSPRPTVDPVTADPNLAKDDGDGVLRALPASDAPTAAGDAAPVADDRRARGASQGEGARGAGSLRPADGERAEERDRGRDRPAGASGGRADGDRAADRVSGRDLTATANWRIEPGSLEESRGPKAKARDNLEAIRIVKALAETGRRATVEEQAKIARYVGWGGLAGAFPAQNGTYAKGMEDIGRDLRALLTDEEYATAERSIQYAHYTSETIVRAMWSMAERLGFNGGAVFEPGMGTGNFAGMMPASVAARTQYEGIEFDHLTHQIAAALYPAWGVRRADYTKTPAVKDVFDLAIGNPPFSSTVIKSDPVYGKLGFVIHDFFFAKTLDAVRPGGLLMFVTSAGTLNKVNAKAREWMADRADLVGAIRLPGGAFGENAGTQVTTDIVVLRKRAQGEKGGDRAWTGTATLALPNRAGETVQGAVSRYFVDHPDMVLGEQGMFDKLVSGERYGVRARPGADLSADLAAAVERLVSSGKAPAARPTPVERAAQDVDFAVSEAKEGSFYLGDDGRLMQRLNNVGVPVRAPGKGATGGISKDGQARIIKLIPVRDALRRVLAADMAGADGDADRAALNQAYDAFVKEFGPINKADITFRAPTIIQQESARAAAREAAREAGRDWNEGSFDASDLYGSKDWSLAKIASARAAARKAAGAAFDEGSFDPAAMDDIEIIKRPNIDPFMADQEAYRLRSIEHYDDLTGKSAKGLVFREPSVRRPAVPQISNARDALLWSMGEFGRPDLPRMAAESGLDRDAILEELAETLFRLPGSSDYVTAETYLSGNVRNKLREAEDALGRGEDMQRNVDALRAALPAPLTRSEITASLGMTWVPSDIIATFAKEVVGMSAAEVSYTPATARWIVNGFGSIGPDGTDWSTPDRKASEILFDALSANAKKIVRTMRDGGSTTTVVDAEATQAVAEKVQALRERFAEWVWKDDARAARLEGIYNETFNGSVAPKFDGSYLTTPGINSSWRYRPHQSAVIARIIQTGNTYMAHGVGAGKTSAMIGAGMEMKRLGLVSKPMYVVPNHMLGQFAKEFYEQYPTARISVADETRFHTGRRKQFVADIANSDLDAVIVTHSSFGLLPMSQAFEEKMIDDQIAQLKKTLVEMSAEGGEMIARKGVQAMIEKAEQRLSAIAKRKKDEVYTFEQIGVDFLFVDEAHLFRKLMFTTSRGDVKGIDPVGSQASFDLFSKLTYLEQRRPGRSAVLASGTPITNTMAELFTLQRLVQPKVLRDAGLDQFDAWAAAFGETETKLEQDPAGGYKPVTRFSKFVNVPELSAMVRLTMDVVTSEQLESLVVRPKLKGGKRNLVVVEQTPGQVRYREQLGRRLEIIRNRTGKPEPGDDILLSVINDGRKSAIDMRLIDQTEPAEDSKLERLIENVHRIWKETKRHPFYAIHADGYSEKPVDYGPATQMIFSDLGVNATVGSATRGGMTGLSAHAHIRARLIAMGVPAKEIALISDFKNVVSRQRLFNDVNEGKVRVLIGSVPKMGTGVNAQKRLVANHNLDPQWYPANDEQRNGRIIRQGNMNPEVEIYDYSTEGTYDSQMWSLMARKARFIEGFMRGDPDMRDMEDLGEASQYEQATALTTADPRVMQMTDAQIELDKLNRRHAAAERANATRRQQIAAYEAELVRNEKRLVDIAADIAQRQTIAGDAFTATVKGTTYTDRAEFGAAVMEVAEAIKTGSSDKAQTIGEIAGFPLVGERFGVGGDTIAELVIRRNGGVETVVKIGTSATGLAQSVQAKIADFEREAALTERRSVAVREDLESLRGASDTVVDMTRAKELRAKIKGIQDALKTEAAALEAAALEAARKAAPVAKQSRKDANQLGIDEKDWPVVERDATAPAREGGIKEHRLALQRWFMDTLRPRKVRSSDGHEVRFARTTLNKLRIAGDTVLEAFPAVAKIVEQGAYLGSRPASVKWAERGVLRAHSYGARVNIRGVADPYTVLVHEMVDGRRFYFFDGLPDVAGGRTFSRYEGAQAPDPMELTPGSTDVGDGAAEGKVARLRQRLAALGIADRVGLEIADTLSFDHAGTFYASNDGARVIQVATDTRQGPDFTLDHEAVHALRNLGLFTKSEWSLLAARARGDTAIRQSVERRYNDLDQDARTEEMIADLFASWVKGRREKPMIARLLQRVLDLLRTVRDVVLDRTDAEGVLRAIDRGEVGAREERSDDADPEVRRESRPDAAIGEAAAAVGRSAAERLAPAIDRIRTAMQDRYLPLLRVQEAIANERGRPIAARENAYLGEELMTGRIGARMDMLTREHIEPLFEAMHKAGITVDELETYLYARHAPERNAQIAKINRALPFGGSGMTDIEASAIMARIARAGREADFEAVAGMVDAMLDWGMRMRVDSGLMSPDEAKAWRDTYAHYVPLRGQENAGGGASAMVERVNRSAGGINVRGKESRRAFGRTTRADNILAYAMLQTQEAIVRSETNRVARAFLNLAQSNPDPELWQIDKVTTVRRLDPTTGMVRHEQHGPLLRGDEDRTVTAKVDGHEYHVTMNTENEVAARLADAMRNLTQHQTDWFVATFGKLNRFLSAVNTSYNPEFIITNAFRDLQSSAMNLAGIEMAGLTRGVMKDYRAALAASMRGAFGKGTGPWDRWYREMTDEGGRVFFNRVDDLDEIKGRIVEATARASGRLGMKRMFVAVRDAVEGVNLGVENAIRLAAYKNARELGASKTQAASIAKNVTVNFNRRGTFGPLMNAAYLFYNASVQGTARLFSAMRSRRVRRMAMGIAAASFAVEMLNAMVGDDDDDGEAFYDKISADTKNRNLVLMLPGAANGGHVKIPLPYGYNIFHALGRSLAEIARRGGDRGTETATDLLTAVVDSFNPVGGTESLLNFIAPTVIDPLVDLTRNRQWGDRPIMPEQSPYGPPDPDAQRYFSSVAPHWKAITDFLSSATGGDEVVAGAIDVSPETLEHLSGVVMGAAGAFIDRTAGMMGKAFDPELTVETDDLPMVRKVTGSKASWYDRSAFHDRLREVEAAVDDGKDYIKQGDGDGLRALVADRGKVLQLESDAKAARREMRRLRKERGTIELAQRKGEVPDEVAARARSMAAEQETLVVQQFNTRWNAVMRGGDTAPAF